MISLSMLYIGLAICYILYRLNAIRRGRLTREIFLVLVVKILLITVIYLLFFSHTERVKLKDIERRCFHNFSQDSNDNG